MPAQGYAKEGSQGKQRSHQARNHIYRMPELLAAKPWAFKNISQVPFLRQDSKHLASTEERQNKFPQAGEGVSFQGRPGRLHVVFVKLRLGRLLFVPSKPAGTTGDHPHRHNRRDPRAPQARPAPPRPAAPRTPSRQLQPRRAAPPRSTRSPPAASPPKARGARTWPRVPAASGRAAGERDYDAESPPLRLPRSAPSGCPRRRRARPRFLALPVPARPPA